MVQVISDNHETKRNLQKLVSLILDSGGWLDDSLVIHCENGEFTVHTDVASKAHELIIREPPACLLPTDQFSLALMGDELTIAALSPGFSEGRRALLETMLELFNQTGKLAAHRETNIWSLSASDPETFKRITEGREKQLYAELDSYLHDETQRDRLLIESFIKTRAVSFTTSLESATREQMLMPIIDFINHHPLAPAYTNYVDSQGHSQLSIKAFHPNPASSESCVRYGYYDTHDLFMNYGYVDTNTYFVRSVPMEISLPGLGEIRVRANCGRVIRKDLPRQIADLGIYLPSIALHGEENRVETAYLLIPQAMAPYALRRVLGIIIRSLDPSLAGEKIAGFVEMAEARIIEHNTSFYTALRDYLEGLEPARAGASVLHNAIEMAAVQLAKLETYRSLHHI